MVKVDMRKSTIYCICECEAIRIQPEGSWDDPEGIYNEANQTCISLWTYGGRDCKTSLKTKWNYIWRIIKHGTPYSDQVIIDETGRRLLIQALQAYDEPIIETITTTTVSQEQAEKQSQGESK